MIAFTAESLFTPSERVSAPVVLVDGDSIVRFGSRNSIEAPSNAEVLAFENCVIAPGFVDIHVHGSAGYDVMQSDTSACGHFKTFLAAHGVTSYFPTTVSAPLDITLAALERLADAIEVSEQGGSPRHVAQPLGIHLEGPFLSRACRGVHPPENLIIPTLSIFNRLWEAARGHIRLMTIAPELSGAEEVITEASRRGVCVSLGHSDGDLASARVAVAAGARHATHTFNAMRRLDHRDPGILAEVLTNDQLTADVIADGIHVAPVILELLGKVKGPERLVLITDAISAAGMPNGRYRLGAIEVELKDGKCTVDGQLAGSALTLDLAVRNTMKFAGWDLQQTLRAVTLNPARVAKTKKGIIAEGADADFVVLTAQGEIRATVVGGQILKQSPELARTTA